MEIIVKLCYDVPMNRRNYQREMEKIIARHAGQRPKLLMHCCCGPCSSSVLERLSDIFELTLLWYNPNIYPEAEFEKRYDAFVKMIADMGLANKLKVLRLEHRAEEYYARTAGYEDAPEGGARCALCFRLRLEETAKIAAEQGFDYFCTTITLSRHKDAVLINSIGETVAKEHGAGWLPSDFKKKDGENRSVELCEQYDVYRQLYCGCEYSFRRRQQIADEIEDKAN